MHWRTSLILVGLVVMVVTPLRAAPGPTATNQQVIGTVQSWNENARTFTVTDDSGKRWDLTWNDATAFLSRPSVGDRVKVSYATNAEGSIRVLRIGKAVKLASR